MRQVTCVLLQEMSLEAHGKMLRHLESGKKSPEFQIQAAPYIVLNLWKKPAAIIKLTSI